MASPKRESPKTEDPMKRVKRPRSNPYENIVQELGFKKGIKYTSNTAKEHYKFTTGCDDKEAELYKEVIDTYFLEISKRMIQNNYPYMWYRVGEFYIAKFNGSPLLNSYQSKKHKQLVSFVNLHTSGWIYQFYWSTQRTVFHNSSVYEFRPVEGIPEICGKKGLKHWIRKLHADNQEVDYNAFVRNSAMVWKRRKKREAEAQRRQKSKEERFKNVLL